MSLRKTLYGEETILVNVRVPISKKDEIKDLFYDLLKRYEVDWSLVDKPEKVKNIKEVIVSEVVSEVVEQIAIEEVAETNNYDRVFTIPRDKVQIKLALYKCSEYFYTRNVLSGNLYIYRWSSLEEAEGYLGTLKK